MEKDTEIYHRFLFELDHGYRIVRVMRRSTELKGLLKKEPEYLFKRSRRRKDDHWYGGYETAIFKKGFNHYLLYLDEEDHAGESETSFELFNIKDEAIGDEAIKKLLLDHLVKNVINKASHLTSKKMYFWSQKEKKWQLKKLSEIH